MRPFPSPMMLSGKSVPVWNAADKATDLTVNAPGNVVARDSTNSGAFRSIRGTISKTPSSGKWYFEILGNPFGGNAGAGVALASMPLTQYPGQTSGAGAFPGSTTVYYNNGQVAGTSVPNASAPVTYGVYLDMSGGTPLIYFSANGSFISGVNPATPTGGLSLTAGTYYPAANLYLAGETATLNTKGPFTYTPVSGYSAWG